MFFFSNSVLRLTLWICILGAASCLPAAGKYCSDCVCGVRGRNSRIVGGSETAAHEFPWLARIHRQGTLLCGASLITRRHLITAAHCVERVDLRDLKIVLGAHNISSRDGIKVGLKNIWVHEDFNSFTFNNDIAVLELKNEVEFGPKIQTICLPDIDFEYTGVAVVAGWGRLGEYEGHPDSLRSISVPIWMEDQCKATKFGQKITHNMICAGYHDGTKDACQGDSGGPLIKASAGGSMEVIGVVSWGRGCARPGLPGIYTKVTNYLPWIQEQLRGQCACPHRRSATMDNETD